MAKRKDDGRPEDCAAAWFLEMERALERGDLGRAVKAQRELLRLGFEVRKARVPLPYAQEAPGRTQRASKVL